MKKTLSLLLVWLGGALAGCAPGSTAAGSALVHSKFPYAVTYDDERTKSILGPEWTLENYRRVEPLNLTYDFTRQLRPDWLSRGEYTEARPTPPSSAPAPTPAGTGTTPAAPSEPVAPEAAAE